MGLISIERVPERDRPVYAACLVMNAAEPSALSDLLNVWRQHPDEESTIALCGYLGATLDLELIQEVGPAGESRFGRNVDVLLAVGRMYLAASLFPPAWRALAYARRADQHDPRPLRYLAEVLLRQGEATRAGELLQRALEHGVTSDDILTLNEQLVEYIEIERMEGAGAVALRVARDALQPQSPSVPRRSTPEQASADEDDTQIWTADDVAVIRSTLASANGARAEFVSMTELLDDDDLPTSASGARVELVSATELLDDDDLLEAEPAARAALPAEAPRSEFLSAELLEDALPLKSSPVYSPATRPSQKTPDLRSEDSIIVAQRGPLERALSRRTSSAPPPRPTLPPMRALSLDPNAHRRSTSRPAPRPPLRTPPPPPITAVPARVSLLPDATVVQPRLRKPQSSWFPLVEATLGVGALVACALLIFNYRSEQRSWEQRRMQATELVQLSELNRLGDLEQLPKLQQRLELLSTSPPYSPTLARFRVRQCVVQTLISGVACKQLAQVLRDAESARVIRRSRVAGEIFLALEKADLAGAVGLVRRWETVLERDPYFQLAAGMAFELTADPHARSFYARARKLDAGLRVARVLEARLVLLDRSEHVGAPLPAALLLPLQGTLEARVLSALGTPNLSKPLSNTAIGAEAESVAVERLMDPVRPLSILLEAREALLARKFVAVGSLLESALKRARSPAVVGSFGFMALDAARIDLAVETASRLELIDSDEPTARVLRARAALLQGNLSEAQRLSARVAADSLGGAQVLDIALLDSIAAYELASAAGVRSALARSGTGVAMSEPLRAAAVGLQLLMDGSVSRSESDSLLLTGAFWGEVVAVDAALDQGDLGFAEQTIERWPAMQERPLHLLRLARLRRYQGRMREGLDITQGLLAKGLLSPRGLTEHALLLLALSEAKVLKELVASRTEPTNPWLAALAEFGPSATSVRIRALALAAEEPLDNRIVAARALALARDPRAKNYVEALQRDFPDNPVVRRLAPR